MTRPRRFPVRKTAVVVVIALVALGSASAALGLRHRASDAQVARARASSVAPIAQLRVLSRHQTPADRAAEATAAARRTLDSLPPLDPGSVRLALRGFGTEDRSAFVARGRDGRICSGLTEFTSGCLDGLPQDMPVDVTYGGETATSGPIVWGAARDDVVAVDVVVNGVPQAATMGENVYAYEAPAGVDVGALGVLKVHLVGGRVVTEPIG